MANPHPKHFHKREFVFDGTKKIRPKGSGQNFNLIGSLQRNGDFKRVSSWIGSGNTPVTPEAEDSHDRIVFLDTEGNELLRWSIYVSFGLRAALQDRGEKRIGEETALISLTVPFPDETAHIELIVDNKAVWSADVPEQPPSIQLLRPTGGEQLGMDDMLTVEWEASHPEGLELEYLLAYSFDGGESFCPLVSGLKEMLYEWQAGLTAKGGRVQIRVVATDGFRQASCVSDDIMVGEPFTRVVIVQPRPGEVIPEGRPIPLLAMAQNVEDGVLSLSGSNTRWILDDEIIVGDGNEIVFKEIEVTTPLGTVTTPPSVGSHKLHVEVTLEPGKIVSDEIAIEIAADSDRDGVPDDVEIERGTSPNDPGDGANIAPIYPFGQWQFYHRRTKTIFQISHLSTGNLSLELRFINEAGHPLATHPVKVAENGIAHQLTTDSTGWICFRLKSLQTVLIELAANDAHRKGFGTCDLRVAANSEILGSIIRAHGWIYHRRAWWLFGWESQGTVVVNGGEPMTIRGAKRYSAYSPQMAVPSITHRLLGRCKMATRTISKTLEEDKK
jgi:hypothetical protein